MINFQGSFLQDVPMIESLIKFFDAPQNDEPDFPFLFSLMIP
jgi:hypothetical protein